MYREVFLQDLANQVPPISTWRWYSAWCYPVLRWQLRLRKIEAIRSKSLPSRLRLLFLRLIHQRDSVRLGFSIPPGAFGPGLSIAHWGTIAVANARIGKNCRIHQGVTIGSANGQFPTIGDNCFIGANACVIGGVTLGNNVRIGAGAVVTKSFGDNAVLVGVPAVDISRTTPKAEDADVPAVAQSA